MSKVISDISMSLDGFVAGPDDSVERLHEWMYDLASWRERHGLEGGETDAAAVLGETFEQRRVIESPAVTHLRFRIIR